jgi:ABC-2 type transport system ATP-binding protein
MLTGYFSPTEGDIRIRNISMSEKPLEIKKMIGYLPESSPFYHNMLVYDYLLYVSEIRGIPSDKRFDRLQYLSDLCGLSEIMHKAIGELSKGLNQRVGLAHAMMSDPEILILDEPTQGLDPNQIAEIRNLIKKISRKKTIIFSTHILSEAEATCNRIIIINQGKIVADGKKDEIKEVTGNTTSIHLTLTNANAEDVFKELKTIDGVDNVRVEKQTDESAISVVITYPATIDLRKAVYLKIKSMDWIILSFFQKKQTLESIFRNLTLEPCKEN